MKIILDEQQIAIIVKRLAQQIMEGHGSPANIAVIGLQPRGIYLADRIVAAINATAKNGAVAYGRLDITFYRDDVRQSLHQANETDIPFSIEGRNVVLVDDVLFTGRTTRAAFDALIDFGRPASVALCVLIDRRFSREFPIQADYVGKYIDSFANQKVLVRWKENSEADRVVMQ